MTISSSQLEAFTEAVRVGSFSKAAEALHITQSALSQRILNLEGEVATTLIIRDPSGLRLTPAGEELLRYSQIKNSLEHEALARISAANSILSGTIRIAGFSSILRSVIMPSISALILKNPDLQLELFNRELGELPKLLARGEADFVLTTLKIQKQDVESILLGCEKYVLAESATSQSSRDFYFDHDPEDYTTLEFFRIQNHGPKKVKTSYLDEVYAIMDAVSLGWGRAVLPSHLVAKNPSLKKSKHFKSLKIPVLLSYYRQPFYSKLHESILNELIEKVPAKLKGRI